MPIKKCIVKCDTSSDTLFTIPTKEYSLSPIKECLIYYLVGYSSKQISTRSKCDICISAFKSMKSFSNISEAELTNFKSMGKLIHPNYVFYKFICKVEDYFTTHINSAELLMYILKRSKISYKMKT